MEDSNKDNIQEKVKLVFQERRKEDEAKFAIVTWIIYGIIRLIGGKIKEILSLILYFFVGIFVASLTAGIINYLVQQLLVRILMKTKVSDSFTKFLSIPLAVLKIIVVVISANLYLNIIQ